MFNKLSRFIFVLISFGMLVLLGYLTYFRFFSKKVFINPVDYDEYTRVVPISQECPTEGSITYYYYERDGDKEKNNKFGIYIYPDNEKFVDLADMLVNSNGGDWGYVLVPYNVKDKDEDKWTRLFYLLNKDHLIPVVQLWNINPEDYEKDTRNAVKFLDKLVWPIKTRYITAYNEPNDANFWYDRVHPEEYAQILDYTIEQFKESNDNYFVMNGALNVSALSGGTYMDAFDFMKAMDEEIPGIFNKIDGWASHSYPQPNFSGDPYDEGRNSIKAYEVELEFLYDELGVDKELPVFITETGWAHDVGKVYNPRYLSIDKVAENFIKAYRDVWLKDDRVVAVMPFSMWYETPGDHFSWVDSRYIPYKHFQSVKAMDKVAGNPEKLKTSEISSIGCEQE